MRNSGRSIYAERSESDDDIDKLFNRLESLKPPSDLLVRILHSISQLSPHPSDPEHPWNNDSQIDGLVVRNEEQEPS